MRTPGTNDVCFTPEARLMPVAEARARVLERVVPLERVESVALGAAHGRVSARDVVSSVDVPPSTNSAMDGFAVAAASLGPGAGARFSVLGTAWAGSPYEGRAAAGEAVRVMTGAALPAGTDTVVPQEDVDVVGADGDGVTAIEIGRAVEPGQNVRQAAEDVARGDVVLARGTRIGAAELGVLASVGTGAVAVFESPVLAVFSTGDELVEAPSAERDGAATLRPGAIYDSNRHVLTALASAMGFTVLDLGILPDERDAVRTGLAEAARRADVVVTSGGVSTGAADFVAETVQTRGRLDVWRIALRPGRPFAFGELSGTLFFGLPGNPVAVMTTWLLLVAPALRRLSGERVLDPVIPVRARTAQRLRKRPGRTEAYRAVLQRAADGTPKVRTTGPQGSGLLRSMSVANCLVILHDDDPTAEAGDWVDVLPFSGLL